MIASSHCCVDGTFEKFLLETLGANYLWHDPFWESYMAKHLSYVTLNIALEWYICSNIGVCKTTAFKWYKDTKI